MLFGHVPADSLGPNWEFLTENAVQKLCQMDQWLIVLDALAEDPDLVLRKYSHLVVHNNPWALVPEGLARKPARDVHM